MSYKITPITITAKISTMVGSQTYGETDGSGLESEYKYYDIALKNIVSQDHSDASTREPLKYNGLDIKVGMFIASEDADTILLIKSISNKSESNLTCVAEDVDMLSFRLNGINNIAPNGNVILFDVNPEGEPIVVGTPFLNGGIGKLQSRFSLNEKDDRIKFIHESAPSVSVGDIVSVDSNGNLVRYGTVGSSETKVGIVLDLIRGGKDVYVKPFNDIIRNFSEPETLDGSPTDVYYTDTSNDGKITTTPGGNTSFLQLNSSIPTTQSIISETLPTSGDTITINGIKVFDGPGSDSVNNVTELQTLLNTFSGDTNVIASIEQSDAVADPENNSVSYSGSWGLHDIFIPLYVVGGTPPANYPEISISNGTNTTNVVFDTSDAVAIGYNVISPSGVANKIIDVLNTDGNFNISVEVYNSPTHNGDAIRLTSSEDIIITNITQDPFGGDVAGDSSSTGIPLVSNLGDPTLTLTRSSGGPIEIDGTPLSGGYLNQGGVVSSNSGRVPYLMLIELDGASSEGGSVTGTTLNKSVLTINNSDSTSVSLDFDPQDDVQSKDGVTTHGFIFLDENSFSSQPFNTVFVDSPSTEDTMFYEFDSNNFKAKTTYVVIDVVDPTSTSNYITVLPEFSSSVDESRVIKFVTKRNNLEVKNDLIVGAKWLSDGNTNRIMSTNLKTKLDGSGFFYPLETLESTDFIYDGSDWLAISVQKQNYINHQPVNYLIDGSNGTVGQFKNRDLDNLA